ncbi:MAG: TonB-dependent receptor, partial [Candidatus Omnitrophica bacterium]|nr:TonB-dependent receptor [Candidatus Omnitrophota bacterium]
HPTSRLTVSPIMRMDFVRIGLENNLTKREGNDVTAAWLPGLGLDYLLHENSGTHAYTSFHKSFQTAEYKEAVDPTTGTANDLEAQAGYHYEIGLKSQPAKWFHTDTAVFLFDFDNETIVEGSARTNGQGTRHAGWEHSMNLDLTGAAEKILNKDIPEFVGNISTNFNFTLLETDFRKGPNNGNQLPYAPNWHYNWSMNYEHPLGIYANLRAEWVDEQFSTGNDSRVENAAGSSGIIPGYKVWDLNFGYDFNDRFGIFMGIKNLFDEKYFMRRDTFFTGIVPSPDRQIYFGTKIKLG